MEKSAMFQWRLVVLFGTFLGYSTLAHAQEPPTQSPSATVEAPESEASGTNPGESKESPGAADETADLVSDPRANSSPDEQIQRRVREMEQRLETVESRYVETRAELDTLKAAQEENGNREGTQLEFPWFGKKDGVWGKVGIAYRVRPEFRDNSDFNHDADDTMFKIGQRARIGVGINFKRYLETFVQVQDTRTFGFENTSVSNPATGGTIDLHQAYAELRMVKDVLALKVGRQQLAYGDQRLVGHLEWLDQGRVFDAAVLKYDYAIGHLELFEAVFTPDNSGNLESGVTHFFGAYDALKFFNGQILVDFYALGIVDSDGARKPGKTFADDPADPGDGATAEEIAAYEEALAANRVSRRVVTLGTRFRLDHKIAKAGFELAGQLGKASAEKDIQMSAMAFHVDAGVVVPIAVAPKISVELNYATGDKNPGDDKLSRFNNLFPTNHMHYGFMDLAAWSNSLNFAVRTGLAPSKYFNIALDYWLLAKATEEDAWYNAGGAAPAGVTASDERLLGHELDLTLAFPISKPLKIEVGASVFFPTATLVDPNDASVTMPGDPQSWTYVMLAAGF